MSYRIIVVRKGANHLSFEPTLHHALGAARGWLADRHAERVEILDEAAVSVACWVASRPGSWVGGQVQ